MVNPRDEGISFKELFIPFTTSKAVHWIIFIGLLVFFNGLFNGFVSDDIPQIQINTLVHAISNIGIFFSGSTFYNGNSQNIGIYYKPLLDTIYSAMYTIFGLNSFAFHSFQLLLHITNAIFVFFILKHFSKKSYAFLLSVIFLVHPINSEVVFYISALQDTLFFFFGALSLLLLQTYHSQKIFLLAGICLLLSLLSKETGILFMFVAIVYIFLYNKKRLYVFLGYVATALGIYALLRIHAIGFITKGLSAPIASLPLSLRLISMPSIFLFYFKTFFYPVALSLSYQWVYKQITFTHFFLPLVFTLLFLLTIGLLAVVLYKKFSKKIFTSYIFFAFWLLLGVAFHLQILPLDQTAADRWFYFPIVGLLGMLGIVLDVFIPTARDRWVWVICMSIIALLSVKTFERSFDWRDNFTLISHDITVAPESYSLSSELSSLYSSREDYAKATLWAGKSIQEYPYVSGYINLGSALSNMGDYKDAKIALLKALRFGDYYLTYEDLATVALRYGNPKENADFIKNVSLKKFPYDANLWLDLAIIDYLHGNTYAAKAEIKQAYLYGRSPAIISAYFGILNNKKIIIGN